MGRAWMTELTEPSRRSVARTSAVGESRIKLIRDLTTSLLGKRSAREACEAFVAVLTADPADDIRWVLAYLVPYGETTAHLAAATRLRPNALSAPSELQLAEQAASPLAQALAGREPSVLDVQACRLIANLSDDQLPCRAVAAPFADSESAPLSGVIIIGFGSATHAQEEDLDFSASLAGILGRAIQAVRLSEAVTRLQLEEKRLRRDEARYRLLVAA